DGLPICRHRVVEDEVRGDGRVEGAGVAAPLGDGVALGREVDVRGHAGEVLHQHPGRQEGDLPGLAPAARPAGQRLDVVVGDPYAVVVAQQVLEQDLQRVREVRDVRAERAQAVDLVALTADLEGSTNVDRRHV